MIANVSNNFRQCVRAAMVGPVAMMVGAMAVLMVSYLSASAENLKFGVITPAKQVWTVNAIQFAEELKSATDGRIDTTIFHSGQLGNEAEMIRQLQTGTLDMALITASEIARRIPEFNALLAPGLVSSNEHAANLLANGTIPKAMLDLLPGKIGVRGLAYGMGGVTQVLARFEASELSDLSGRKVRITPSPAVVDFEKLIGSAPLPIPLPGVYDAFANGQVDAVELNLDVIRLLRLPDIAKTLLITNQAMFPGVILVSEKTWRDLSDADKNSVTQSAERLGQRILDQTVAAENSAMEFLTALPDLKIVQIPASSFSEIIVSWDKVWAPRAPQLKALREEASGLQQE